MIRAMSRVKKRPSNFHLPWKQVLHLIIFFSCVSAAIVIINRFKEEQHFPIKSVQIYGADHLNHDETQQILKPYVKNGYFGIHLEAIKERLLQDPWVSDVRVMRVWPDQVVINIIEKTPIAYWNEKKLLSSKGEVFFVTSGNYSSQLPRLIGPEGKHLFVIQYYNKISYLFRPLHFSVARLELTPEKLWKVTLDNGIKLTASHKDVLTRLSHFVKVYTKIIGERATDVDYVDLRYANGLAVKWKSIT